MNNDYTKLFSKRIGNTNYIKGDNVEGEFYILTVSQESSQVLVNLSNGYTRQVRIKNSSSLDLNSHLQKEFDKNSIKVSRMRVLFNK